MWVLYNADSFSSLVRKLSRSTGGWCHLLQVRHADLCVGFFLGFICCMSFVCRFLCMPFVLDAWFHRLYVSVMVLLLFVNLSLRFLVFLMFMWLSFGCVMCFGSYVVSLLHFVFHFFWCFLNLLLTLFSTFGYPFSKSKISYIVFQRSKSFSFCYIVCHYTMKTKRKPIPRKKCLGMPEVVPGEVVACGRF